jgi:hypothetical protein
VKSEENKLKTSEGITVDTSSATLSRLLGPLHPLVDYRLYWYLQSNSISTGIFYRDIYWKFPKLFDNSGLKYWELQLRYRLDLAVMKRIGDVIYTPSTSFGEHLETPTTPLPPGGIDQTSTSKSSTQLQRLIYVGGASDLQ